MDNQEWRVSHQHGRPKQFPIVVLLPQMNVFWILRWVLSL